MKYVPLVVGLAGLLLAAAGQDEGVYITFAAFAAAMLDSFLHSRR